MKVFIHDVSICNGCHNCQIACKDEHVDNDWTPIAKPQPDTGHFWLKQNEHICGTVPKVKIHYTPVLCNHCDDAPCIKSCKQQAIYKREDGLAIIDPTKCKGSKDCIAACPYGVIYFNDEINIAQKCTGCAHLLDKGWKEPRCVDACPTGALKFMEESEAQEYIKKADYLKPERVSQDKPRVHYVNLPKRFVAGTVYDPVKKEVVIGAKCVLTESSGKSYNTLTDEFGDFWFKGLKAGSYSLVIEAKGFTNKVISSIQVEKDVNLGDIPLK